MTQSTPDIPGYQIKSQLGQGGMADVYLATQDSFNRPVALKVMFKHLLSDDTFAKRFKREAQLAANLSHQNIVPIFDVGEYEDNHYIAMEYLPGGDLKQKISTGIQLIESIAIVQTIANALDFAGRKSLVHRDIKPENILFREDGSPVLSDFGIARQINSKTNMTVFGSAVGTPNYMSPEQAQGENIDHRSDLYSLGVILYELITGHVPFSSESAVSVSVKHITEAPPPLPQEFSIFQPIIDKALAKAADDRFQSGKEFANALARAEDGMSLTFARTVVLSTEDVRTASAMKSAQNSQLSGYQLPPESMTGTTDNALNSQVQNAHSAIAQAPSAIQSGIQNPTQAVPAKGHSPLLIGALVATLSALGISLAFNLGSDKAIETSSSQSSPAKIASNATLHDNSLLINAANKAVEQGKIFAPEEQSALFYLSTLLAINPENKEARELIEDLFSQELSAASSKIDSIDLPAVEPHLNNLERLSFYVSKADLKSEFKTLSEHYHQQKTLAKLVRQAELAMANGNLTSPFGNNAYDFYLQIQRIDPKNQIAKAGIINVSKQLLNNALESAKNKHFIEARALIRVASQLTPQLAEISQVKERISKQENDLKQTKVATTDDRVSKKQKRIQSLLERVSELDITGAESNTYLEALEIYEEILSLDTTNLDAIKGKEQLGQQRIELAKSLADQDRFDEARKALAEAASIGLSDNEIGVLTAYITQRQNTSRIDSLLAKATSAFEANRLSTPEQNNAGYYYREVLKLEPNHEQAKNGFASIGKRYLELARQRHHLDQFDKALSFLDKAEPFLSSERQVSELRKRFVKDKESFRAKAKSTQKVASIEYKRGDLKSTLNQANSLLKDLNKDSYIQARDLFRQVLKQSPNVVDAKAGLAETLLYQIEHIDHDLLSESLTEAEEYLKSIRQEMPTRDLSSQWQQFNRLNQVKKEVSFHLREADRLINFKYISPGLLETNGTSRDRLTQAYQHLNSARFLAPRSPELERHFDNLERKYTSIIRQLSEENRSSDIGEFLNDLELYYWDGISRLLEQAEKHEYEATQKTAGGLKGKDRFLFHIQEATQLINTPYKLQDFMSTGLFTNLRQTRMELVAAYSHIYQANSLFPNDKIVLSALNRLEHKYAELIRGFNEIEEQDKALTLFHDAKCFDWKEEEFSETARLLRTDTNLKTELALALR